MIRNQTRHKKGRRTGHADHLQFTVIQLFNALNDVCHAAHPAEDVLAFLMQIIGFGNRMQPAFATLEKL